MKCLGKNSNLNIVTFDVISASCFLALNKGILFGFCVIYFLIFFHSCFCCLNTFINWFNSKFPVNKWKTLVFSSNAIMIAVICSITISHEFSLFVECFKYGFWNVCSALGAFLKLFRRVLETFYSQWTLWKIINTYLWLIRNLKHLYIVRMFLECF